MTTKGLDQLRAEIAEFEAYAIDEQARFADELARVHPVHLAAAKNLTHYLALRQHDVRELQSDLAELGLSSLGRAERCVLATLHAVDRALAALAGRAAPNAPRAEAPTSLATADAELAKRTSSLLGAPPSGRSTRMLLTLSPDVTSKQVEALLAEGVDAVRINCSKGDAEVWRRMVEDVRKAQVLRGRECPILFDLEGPNPRTLALDGSDNDEEIGRAGVGDVLCLAKTRPKRKRKAFKHALFVGCTLPSVLDDLRPGERIYYDDGKLSGKVTDVTGEGVLVELTFAQKRQVKVRSHKGLNFPDSKLKLPPLTEKDLAALKFIALHADMVGLSFVRTPEDVEAVQQELARLGVQPGIVLKIETTPAFQALPRLLLTAMRSPRVGIMVARGDMAIELGFERLAEAQEEVLWMSEAAFVPVIWATQVLDGLNKTGMPSRAEVTDAAMGSRAECVMLNQGKHQLETLRFLRNVLERMQEHQQKKRSMLRRLQISEC